MPDNCAEEQETQHYLGASHGFGPVRDSEYVYLAIFDSTPRDGDRVAADSFENKHLKRDGQSVSRASHTTRRIFDDYVVRAGSNPKGRLDGVSSALAGAIRALQSKITLNSSEVLARSFCVLDFVLRGDYDSHATIHYGERTSAGLSEKQIKTIRTKACLELAEVFGQILPDAEVTFAGEPNASC